MLRAFHRAVGPAVALEIRLLKPTPKQPKTKINNLSIFSAKHQLVFEIMGFTAFYDSLVSLPSGLIGKDDAGSATNIAKMTASHEEAMLLEEPSSPTSTQIETTCKVATIEAATATRTGTNTESWKHLPQPITVEGVELADSTTLTVNDTTLTLYRNGHGVRTVKAPFGYNLHVYVATLYTQHPIRNEQDVRDLLESNTGFVMEFTFLRNVSPSQMSIAWNYQLDTSVTDSDYETYKQDRDVFVELLDGSMKEGGVMRFDFQPDRLEVTNQGHVAGDIDGTNFSKAFVSMWLGDKPVMKEIKDGLFKADTVGEQKAGTKVSQRIALQEVRAQQTVKT